MERKHGRLAPADVDICDDRSVFARTGRYAAAYTHRSPSRDDELRLLIRWIAQRPGDGLLFVGPQVRSLQNSSVASALVKAGQASYTTWKNKDWWRQARVIALWPDAKTLQNLDDVATIEALGVLTWNLEDVTPWAAGVGAEDLLGEATIVLPAIGDPVVLGALRVLTNAVNLSTGLSHPSDWDHAVHSFRALRKKGHRLDGAEIEAWALANGWSYADASDVGQLAQEIAEGKAKRTKSRGTNWKPTAQTFKLWREVAEEADWTPF